MNSLINHIITVGVASLFLKQTAGQKCKIPFKEAETGLEGADCSGGILTDGLIPQELGSIAFLDISNNMLKEVAENSFSKYASLQSLKMQNVKSKDSGSLKVHEKAFTPLTKLAFLDMTNTPVASPNEKMQWPVSLRNLSIAYCNFESIDMSKSIYLENFNATSNKLQTFPNFGRLTPLTSIDVLNNPIRSLSPDHIAPFCYLKYFGVIYTEDTSNGGNEVQYCNCSNLAFWLDTYNIAPGSINVNCSYGKEHSTNCSKYLENACLERRLCFRRTDLDITLGYRVLGIALFIICILLLVAAAKAKPVTIAKVADTHPFEHVEPSTSTSTSRDSESEND